MVAPVRGDGIGGGDPGLGASTATDGADPGPADTDSDSGTALVASPSRILTRACGSAIRTCSDRLRTNCMYVWWPVMVLTPKGMNPPIVGCVVTYQSMRVD